MRKYKEFKEDLEQKSKSWDEIVKDPKLVGHIQGNSDIPVVNPEDEHDEEYLKKIGKGKKNTDWEQIVKDAKLVGQIPSLYNSNFPITP